MNFRYGLVLLLVSACWGSPASVCAAEVTVVVGKAAEPLEQTAAQELDEQFQRLFDLKVSVSTELPTAGHVVLLGSPATNPHIQELDGFRWPQVSAQGVVIRSHEMNDLPGAIIGGGSPVASLWAVYEFGYQLGARYLLRGDIFPERQPLKLSGWNVVQEPELPERTWRTVNDFALGPESWPVDDQARLFKQLAKLRFNKIMLSVYPWQPFVHYQFRGVEKRTAMLWYGEVYEIDSDSPGRVAFRGKSRFENPDFAGADSYEAKLAAGRKHLSGLIKAAHDWGMEVGVSLSPLEFPREFAKAVPGLVPARGLKDLDVAPGPTLGPSDEQLAALVKTKIRAYLTAYPDLDELYLTLPEFPEWAAHAETAWTELVSDAATGKLTRLIEEARERPLTARGDRGATSVRGNVASLAFLRRVFADRQLLQRGDGEEVALTITSVDPALFPYLDRVLPPGAGTLQFVDYTARRVAANKEYLKTASQPNVDTRLILTLADDNLGVLSQNADSSLEELVNLMTELGWKGFSTRYWALAELDPTVHYLSRASWQRGLTLRDAHDDLFTMITGRQSVSDRLWLGFRHIENATHLTDRNDLGFAFPVPGMLMKHYESAKVPDWWEKQAEEYNSAMVELYRSRDAAHARSQPLLYYYAKRSEYVLDYLNCLKSLKKAAALRDAEQHEAALEEVETALESIYNAIDTLGDVAQDQSDRGLIAILIKYAYRPVELEYERLIEIVDSAAN